MTLMPSEVRVLEPGTADARESQDDIGVSMGGDPTSAEELTYVGLGPIELVSQYQPTLASEPIADLGSAAHDQIEIGSLLDNRLRMRESITLVMEHEGEFYIAKCDELNEIGYGEDPISAVQDIRNTIAELYWQLKENEERLGTDLAITWQRLSALVCKT